ncbi:MAG: T9SS type A sorting domain-containing protein [Aureispira sp.]|nr:T9SS type A sorting domain-containing protein [Aureispira sp.]
MKTLSILLQLLLFSVYLNAQKANQGLAFMNKHSATKATFEENKGQVWSMQGASAGNVQYHLKQEGIDIFLLETGIAYQFSKTHYPEGYQHDQRLLSLEELKEQELLEEQIRIETYRMDMSLINANPKAEIIAEGVSEDYVNYYNRNSLAVQSFQKLTYQEIYPGIDWVIYTTANGLKYDFVVAPGADPSLIQMKFKHHEAIAINEDGSLTLTNAMGTITEKAPISFQEDKEVITAFALDNDVIRFQLEDYDASEVLRIDPSLLWASYYGGNNNETGYSCTTDASGNVYMVGWAESSSNIALGGHQNTYGTFRDAYIVKFNSVGVRQWASYYGGTATEYGHSCSVDANGNVYMVGWTKSSSNIASGVHQDTLGGVGNFDAYIVKFNSAGVRQWASYYGGAGTEYGNACVVDGSGNVYMSGYTNSATHIGFGGHQNSFGGGNNFDAFIVKFNSVGIRQWGSYYGNSNEDRGLGCAVDGGGNVYMVGVTESTSSIASGGYQNTIGGARDAYIVKFSSAGVRQWASYYGSNDGEIGFSCAVDGSGDVYMSGWTESTFNIATSGHQYIYGTNGDAYIVKFNSAGVRQWASYYGGVGADYGFSCAVDPNKNVYMMGETTSTTDITFGGHQNTYGGAKDAYIVKFNSAGVRQWASYYGGSNTEYGVACAVDVVGNLYLVGTTYSSNNISLGGHQNSLLGTIDAYIAKFDNPTPTNIVEVNPFFEGVSISPNPTVEHLNINLGELESVSIRVYGVGGELVYEQKNITGTNPQIELKGPVGVYIVELNADGKQEYFKVVKNSK